MSRTSDETEAMLAAMCLWEAVLEATGSPGANRIAYSQWEGGSGTGWAVAYNPSGLAISNYRVETYLSKRFLGVWAQATAANQQVALGTDSTEAPITVLPGERLALNVGFQAQTAVGSRQINAYFYDASGSRLSELWTQTYPGGAGYDTKVGGFIDVPASAVRMELQFFANSSGAGRMDIAVIDPMLCSASVGQTALPSFVPGPVPDSAAVVNASTTKINPGQIIVAGSTTIADWRHGSDLTKIDGGDVFANSITANKLTIGNRGLNFIDLNFQVVFPFGVCTLKWDGGYVQWRDASGPRQVTISGSAINNAAKNSSYPDRVGDNIYTYLYWTEGATTLQWTQDSSVANGENAVCLVTWYSGDVNFVANFGGVIIDGTRITAGTITADRIAANSITSNQMAANAIRAVHIQAEQIDAGKLTVGGVTTSRIADNAATNQITVQTTSTFYGDGGQGTYTGGGGGRNGGQIP